MQVARQQYQVVYNPRAFAWPLSLQITKPSKQSSSRGRALACPAHHDVTQQPAREEDSEDAAPVLRQLTTTELSAALSHFEAGLQVLTSGSPGDEWTLQVSRAVSDAITCYRELHSEKERRSKQQLS
ncbi:hypothetical protein CB1_000130005 [Camelus ferus]|nr:hypothetical protein CB1_000130005 [Camelus ferus]